MCCHRRVCCCAPVWMSGHIREEPTSVGCGQRHHGQSASEMTAIQQALDRIEKAVTTWMEPGRPTPPTCRRPGASRGQQG